MDKPAAPWTLYMIRCADGSLYTGITTELERRLAEHRNTSGNNRGAKYLRGRLPLELAYQTQLPNRSEASRLEYTVKQSSKADKEALAAGTLTVQELQQRRTQDKRDG